MLLPLFFSWVCVRVCVATLGCVCVMSGMNEKGPRKNVVVVVVVAVVGIWF